MQPWKLFPFSYLGKQHTAFSISSPHTSILIFHYSKNKRRSLEAELINVTDQFWKHFQTKTFDRYRISDKLNFFCSI